MDHEINTPTATPHTHATHANRLCRTIATTLFSTHHLRRRWTQNNPKITQLKHTARPHNLHNHTTETPTHHHSPHLTRRGRTQKSHHHTSHLPPTTRHHTRIITPHATASLCNSLARSPPVHRTHRHTRTNRVLQMRRTTQDVQMRPKTCSRNHGGTVPTMSAVQSPHHTGGCRPTTALHPAPATITRMLPTITLRREHRTQLPTTLHGMEKRKSQRNRRGFNRMDRRLPPWLHTTRGLPRSVTTLHHHHTTIRSTPQSRTLEIDRQKIHRPRNIDPDIGCQKNACYTSKS